MKDFTIITVSAIIIMYWGHGDKSKCVMPSFLTLLFMCMSWLVPVEVTNKGLHLTELSVPDCSILHRDHYLRTHCRTYFMHLHGQMTIQQARIQVSGLPVDLLPLPRGLWENASKRLQFFKLFQSKNLQGLQFHFFLIYH